MIKIQFNSPCSFILMLISFSSKKNNHKFVIGCCKDKDLCNANLPLVLNITEENKNLYGSSFSKGLQNVEVLLPIICSAVFLFALIGVVTVYLLLIRKRNPQYSNNKKHDCLPFSNCLTGSAVRAANKTITDAGYHQVEIRSHTESTVQAGKGISAVSDSELDDLLCTTSYSGSGSGVPVLVQRSVARQVRY